MSLTFIHVFCAHFYKLQWEEWEESAWSAFSFVHCVCRCLLHVEGNKFSQWHWHESLSLKCRKVQWQSKQVPLARQRSRLPNEEVTGTATLLQKLNCFRLQLLLVKWDKADNGHLQRHCYQELFVVRSTSTHWFIVQLHTMAKNEDESWNWFYHHFRASFVQLKQ